MAVTDAQITATRRRLYRVIGQSYERIGKAAQLLAPFADIPGSAEAEAYKLLIAATKDIEHWSRLAGELVDVEFLARHRSRPSILDSRRPALGSGSFR